ncbi:uncharacterized protein Dana_GF26954, isoform B [Drosophila ananassae]|uniref:Uncharacterized protein, isoform B n=1 Tax=Drosophila ananassae TaxID=7217 RepID=A0A0P8Y7D1_DROAN|nr:uncharacterized protein LOC26514363 isoform X1 [Drosophila ananassae]KPU77321.1 uncharacterized protein Dana_GF26954, isoform B [Drosophila ananassae]
MDLKSISNIVFENGTLLGSMPECQSNRHCGAFVIPEIVISSCQSNNSLHRVREDNRVNINSIHRKLSTCSEQKVCTEQCIVGSGTVISSNVLNASLSSGSDSVSKHEKCSDGSTITAKDTRCSASSETTVMAALEIGYPPQYSNIYRDRRQNHVDSTVSVNTPVQQTRNISSEEDRTNSIQYFQYCQHRRGIAEQNPHHDHSNMMNVTVPLSGNSLVAGSRLLSTNSTNITGSSNEVPIGGCSFRKWFLRPSLPFVIGVFALGGVAFTLGGIVLGSTGLLEHSTQYLSAALLMIGIGVSLIVISGAIWRLSLLDDADDCSCFRRFETCHNCHNPHCNNRQVRDGYIYTEFQHRPPPPSYLTSLNEYTLVYYPNVHSIGISTPPPLYRSTYSLNVLGPMVPPAEISQLQNNTLFKDDRSSSNAIKKVKSSDQLTSAEISETGLLIQETEEYTTNRDYAFI